MRDDRALTAWQQVPVRVYPTSDRLMMAAPLPGARPEDILVEVDSEGRLSLQAAGGDFKEEADKELLLDEWDGRPDHRDLVLPMSVEADHAAVTYGNGVPVLALPLAARMRPARLRLESLRLATPSASAPPATRSGCCFRLKSPLMNPVYSSSVSLA